MIINPLDSQDTQTALNLIKADCDTLNASGVGTSIITASNLSSQDYEAAINTQATNQNNLNTDNSLGLTLIGVSGDFQSQFYALYQRNVQIADIILSSPTYNSEIESDSPTRFFKLNEPSGTVVDDSTETEDGDYIGSPTLGATSLDGSSDTSVDFSGSGQYADIGYESFGSLLFSSAWSIDFLYNSSDNERQSVVGSINTGNTTAFILQFNTETGGDNIAGMLRIFTRNESAVQAVWTVDVGAELYDGNPHHVAVTHAASSSDIKVYFDGVEQIFDSSQSLMGSYAAFDYPLIIASRNNRGTIDEPYDGSLGKVAFYTSELSSARISARVTAAGL